MLNNLLFDSKIDTNLLVQLLWGRLRSEIAMVSQVKSLPMCACYLWQSWAEILGDRMKSELNFSFVVSPKHMYCISKHNLGKRFPSQMHQKDTSDEKKKKKSKLCVGENINLVCEHFNFSLCKFLIVFILFCNRAVTMHSGNTTSSCNKNYTV